MRRASIVALTILAACFAAAEASAAVFTVDRTDDPDPATADDCTAAANDCSLRGAVIKANTDAAADDITVPAGTYTLTIVRATETGQDTANQFEAEGDIDISQPVTITGAGADLTTIQAGGSFDDRLFHPAISSGTVTLRGMTLDANNHFSSGRGGVLYAVSGGTVEVDDCVVKNGIANEGGGLSMNAPLAFVIRNTTISGNSGTRGGGFFCETGTCLIVNSTFSGNTSVTTGGGAIDNTTGVMTIINSTFVGNTVTDNAGTGGGLRVGQGVTIKNSILVNNTVNGTPANCDGDLPDLSSGGHNLSDDGTCSTRFSATGDANGVTGTIVSAALADNGGPVPTHLIPSGSPAIDLVPIADCTDNTAAALTEDQRGFVRPAGSLCDAGAVEVGCGNGNVDAGEGCDDANGVDTDACTNACAVAVCGDGSVQTGVEACDDGNTGSGDGCSDSCAVEDETDDDPDEETETTDATDDGGSSSGTDANGSAAGGCSLVF